MADYLTTDTELTSIANAIRTKGGTAASLTYPTGFVSAINAIPTGGGVDARWWGGIEPELIGETLWSKSPTAAANWPITPSTSAQNLTWRTNYTTTASANATIDRIGKGYHGVTEDLAFGTYNFIVLNDAYVHIEYTVDEATMGKAHITHQGASDIFHFGMRPKTTNGQIIRPSATVTSTAATASILASQSLYRNESNVLSITNAATYGIGITTQLPSKSTNYFDIKTPTFTIRANSKQMAVDAYSYIDWSKTTINYQCRIYRVPAEYGLLTQLFDRNLDMILDEAFQPD